MVCPKCRNDNPGHARFCGKCGHPIAPPQPSSPTTPRSGKATNFFKWVGYIFSGLIVLGMLSNCNF